MRLGCLCAAASGLVPTIGEGSPRIGTQRLRRAVSATAIARAKDRSAISRVQGSLPLQVWINAACGLGCWMTHVAQLQKPLELRTG